jgi:hypothetical protein
MIYKFSDFNPKNESISDNSSEFKDIKGKTPKVGDFIIDEEKNVGKVKSFHKEDFKSKYITNSYYMVVDFRSHYLNLNPMSKFEIIENPDEKMVKAFENKKINQINEAFSEKIIQKKVAEINKMISLAINSDGDAIEVIDKSSTWEAPMKYKPIKYSNGGLYIEYEEYTGHGKPAIKKERINKSNMELDGIGTLNNIAKMYRSALKKHGISYKDEVVKESLKDDLVDKLSPDYKDIKEELLNIIGKSINSEDIDLAKKYIKTYIEKPEDTTLTGLVNDSDIFDFFTKYTSDIDEVLTKEKWFDKSPSDSSVFSVYDYVTISTKKAIIKVMNLLYEDLNKTE